MNQHEFLSAVRARLAGLPQGDADRFLDYCREMIADRMEDGLSEAEAIAAMGTPEEVASQLLLDTPTDQAAAPKSHRQRLKAWQILLIVLGSPLWASLLLTLVIAAVSLVIGLAAVLFGLYCAAGGIIIGGLGAIIGGFAKIGMPDLLFALAAGFLLTGIGLLILLGLNWLDGLLIRLVRRFCSIFRKKEASQ